MSKFDPIKFDKGTVILLKINALILLVTVIALVTTQVYKKTGQTETVTDVPRIVTVKEISKDSDGDKITFVDKTDNYEYKVPYTEEHSGLEVGNEYNTICTIKVKHFRDETTYSKRKYTLVLK